MMKDGKDTRIGIIDLEGANDSHLFIPKETTHAVAPDNGKILIFCLSIDNSIQDVGIVSIDSTIELREETYSFGISTFRSGNKTVPLYESTIRIMRREDCTLLGSTLVISNRSVSGIWIGSIDLGLKRDAKKEDSEGYVDW